MIWLLTGKPGSGKTYWVVHMIANLPDKSKILHNIEGLKLGIDIDTFCSNHNLTKSDIFKKSWHEKNDILHGWTIIIDEAASLFPKAFKDTDTISFFDYHRHYGLDIYLLTQDVKKVCYDITCLAETHLRAASAAANPIPGWLMYQQMVSDEAVGKKFLRKKKSIYQLYKSAHNHSSSILNVGKIYVIVIVIAVVILSFAAKSWFNSMKPKEQTNQSYKSAPEVASSSDQSKIPTRPISTQKNTNQISNTLGGKPYPLSSIRDYSGMYYIISGLIIRSDLFPWPVVQTRTGPHALLPDTVYNEVLEYQKNLDTTITTSPGTTGQGSGSEREARASAGQIGPG